MTSIFFIPALALLTCLAGPVCAMNNNDLIKLAKAGLQENTIILAVRYADKRDFDTSADALIALSKEGVSSEVINHIIICGGTDKPAQNKAPATSCPAEETPAPKESAH